MLFKKSFLIAAMLLNTTIIWAQEIQTSIPVQKEEVKKVDKKLSAEEEKLKNKLLKLRKDRVIYFLDKRIGVLDKEKKCLKKIKSNDDIKKCNEQSQMSYKELRLELEKSKNEYAEEKRKIDYLNLEKSGIELEELEIEIAN